MDVWLISLESSGVSILSPDEELRAARFHFDTDRDRWIRARSSLRFILATYAGIPARDIRFVLGSHGKPALANDRTVEFSLSHSGSWAMVAITRNVPVGIDIERIRENVNIAALLRRLGEKSLPETQAGLFSAWARREAMTKAVGAALLEAPVGDLRVCDLDAPAGYSSALALVGIDPRVRRHNDLVLPSGTA